MTWQRFCSLLIRQWRLVVICFLAAGASAFIVSKIVSAVYVSTALVQVTLHAEPGASESTSLQAAEQLARTNAQLAMSYSVLQAVAPNYVDLTETALAREVAAFARPGTSLFEIKVFDNSPERAASLANDIATALVDQQETALKQSNSRSQTQIQQELTKTLKQINDILAQIGSLPGNDATKNAILQAQLEAQEQRYSQWQDMQSRLNLSQAQSSDFLQVVQPAQPDYVALRPDTLKNMEVGLLVGLLLGIVLVVLYELLDVHVHTLEDGLSLLGWPLLGTIWRANSEANEQAFNPHGREMNAEAYRILRTNLGFSSQERPLHTLLVTSAGTGEGKSTVSANLAIFMARAGKNTLLVDADLRSPTLHTLFSLSPEKQGLSSAVVAMGNNATTVASGQFVTPGQTGITDALGPAAAQATLEPYFHYVGLPNLRVMPAGPLPANPVELLDSKTMQRLLALVETSGADIVIFDVPPVCGFADASVLAAKVDGTLVVIDPMLPTRAQMRQMRMTLLRSGAYVLGCVANRQKPARQDLSLFDYYDPDARKRGVGPRLSRWIFQKEAPASGGDLPSRQSQRLVHTAYHGRNQ